MEEEVFKVTGGCLCGAVRYEAEVLMKNAYYCHCRTCQKSSGTPAEVDVLVKGDSLKFTKEPPKYFRSSHFAERGFCSTCGSRITYRFTDGGYTNLTVGSLDDPSGVVPTQHFCVETQVPWYRIEDDLPRLRTEEIPELVAMWEQNEGAKK